MLHIKSDILDRVNDWLTPTFDDKTQEDIKILMSSNTKELEESFYQDLDFGTGGMRGVMGVGTNRINKYTLGKNTQGLSNYLKKSFPNEVLKTVIAFDCRNNSKELAQVVANVFSANGIQVYLFEELRTTPELSFSVRHLHCHCGIVLTASHNPPEYNGYKVYWQDGGQLVPPQDSEIIKEINKVEYSEIQFDANDSLITRIGSEVDEAFLNAVVANGSFNTSQEAKDNFKIVFTSLHGTSIVSVPPALEKAGYKNVHVVEEQAQPNGNFPTVKSPNPEEPEALEMALDLAEEVNADIVIGTDPDSDRLGIAVRNLENKMELLNGNQAMVVMTDFLLKQWKHLDQIDGNEFIASTIVSTPMMKDLAADYGVDYKVGLTGFKWIAKMIKDFPNEDFVGGGEESFGFMVGDFVRDKDAVTSTLMACEIAARAKENGSSFYEHLLELYLKHGLYKEDLVSITKKGIEGAEEIQNIMKDARSNPPTAINGSEVIKIEDYKLSTSQDRVSNKSTLIELPKSNVLIYYTEDGSRIALRPSGTEPKIKYYISVKKELSKKEHYKNALQELDEKIEYIKKDLNIN